jgi:putative transposase
VALLLEAAEEELLAFTSFPRDNWAKLRSTNPVEHVNKEIVRRSDAVGIYLSDESLIRLAGALWLEQNVEGVVGSRYLSGASLAGLHAAWQTDEPRRAALSGWEVVLLAIR